MSIKIICDNCKQTLNESIVSTASLDVPPCPSCGSRKRVICTYIQETVKIKEKVSGKTKKQGIKKPTYEFVAGDDLHNKSGKWHTKKRIIDRDNDRYEEVVSDPETGKIIHRCDEPLSKHRGHGLAKVKISKEIMVKKGEEKGL